jgi:cytochrome c5
MHPKTTTKRSTASILEQRTHPASEADDIIEDNEVLGILDEDQLTLRALLTKNNHLQK